MIRDMKKDDRPREKLLRTGAISLSDTELIQALIGSGTAQASVGKISKELNRLLARYDYDISYANLKKIDGLGPARIAQILATLELGKRHVRQQHQPQTWYAKSRIDYIPLFMNIYISFNVWYVKVTGKSVDSDAIVALKKRYEPWDEYEKGIIMTELPLIIDEIMSEEKPYVHIKSTYDWRALIDFWYFVRCQVFHGAWSYGDDNTQMVRLAYESLSLFMDEVIRRSKV